MSHEECEHLNSLTRANAAKRLQVQKNINAACWGMVFLLGFLLGLAM